MTNKISKEFLFTELSIKIATLEMKLDKILELLNTPEVEYQIVNNVSMHEHILGVGSTQPPQWPNESRTDYLKRIGQYVEAYSDNEKFSEEIK